MSHFDSVFSSVFNFFSISSLNAVLIYSMNSPFNSDNIFLTTAHISVFVNDPCFSLKALKFRELNVGHIHLLSRPWNLTGFWSELLNRVFCRFFLSDTIVFLTAVDTYKLFNVQLYKVFLFVVFCPVFCARSGWCSRQIRARASTITGHACVNSVQFKGGIRKHFK